jgi:hypothetical protein
MAELPPYPGIPRWVKVSGIVIGILAVLLLVIVVTGVGGPHGPGRHTFSADGVAGHGPIEGGDR